MNPPKIRRRANLAASQLAKTFRFGRIQGIVRLTPQVQKAGIAAWACYSYLYLKSSQCLEEEFLEILEKELFHCPISIQTRISLYLIKVLCEQIKRLIVKEVISDSFSESRRSPLNDLFSFLLNTARMVKLFREFLEEELNLLIQIVAFCREVISSQSAYFYFLHFFVWCFRSADQIQSKAPQFPVEKLAAVVGIPSPSSPTLVSNAGDLPKFVNIPFRKDLLLHFTHSFEDFIW